MNTDRCEFEMKIVGREDEVREFANALMHPEDPGEWKIGRTCWFRPDKFEMPNELGVCALKGTGYCKGSIRKSLMREGIEGECRGTEREGTPFRSLEGESERLKVAVEAYSHGFGGGFEEHILIVDGFVREQRYLASELVDREDMARDLEKYNRRWVTSHTQEDVERYGLFAMGGFDSGSGDFSEVEKYLGIKVPEREMSVDELAQEARRRADCWDVTYHAVAGARARASARER